MMDPTFAENTAGIIYMGGAVDVPGNANNGDWLKGFEKVTVEFE